MKALNALRPFYFQILLCFFLPFTLQAQLQGSGHVSYHELFSTSAPGKDETTIQRAINRGTIISDDTAVPFHLATQTCSGTNVLGKQGQPLESHGSCDMVDADGDIWWLSYHNQANGENTWQITGGTGKYKGMKGGGTTTPLFMSSDGKMLSISYEGKWTMK